MSKGAYIGVPTLPASLGDKAIGDTIKLNVNGVATDFLVVHQGNPDTSKYDASCDGTWLLMKTCYPKMKWDSTNNDYGNSDIHAYLNNEFFALFDTNIQSAIKQVKIPYFNSSEVKNGANGLSTKVFLLSGYEVGSTTSDNKTMSVEGAKLDYFETGESTTSAKNLRIAYPHTGGSAANWWLRSGTTDSAVYCCYANYQGLVGTNFHVTSANDMMVRPAIVMPSNLALVNGTVDGTEAGWKDVARKIKKAYIGVPTEFPVYEEQTTTITENNVTDFFDVEDASYGFEGANGVFSSSATSGTSSSRISESTWVSKKDIKDFSFSYVVGNRSASTLANLVITVGGKDVVNSTTIGEKGSWSGAIKEGEAIEFYSRNSSTPSTISNIVATAQTQTGTETKDVARKVKKAYIGDENGVARLCFCGQNPVYKERMLVYDSNSNVLNFTDLPFEPKFIAVENIGTIASASGSYILSLYADKESGLMRIVYKNISQSGFMQYKETYNGDGSFKVEWGKNSFYAYTVGYYFYNHTTSGNPYQVVIWG